VVGLNFKSLVTVKIGINAKSVIVVSINYRSISYDIKNNGKNTFYPLKYPTICILASTFKNR
jgi:hypothetical protein